MKTRSGFVSNSSTSSFVVIGYDLNEISEDLLKTNTIDPANDSIHEFCEGKDLYSAFDGTRYIVGKLVVDGDENDFGSDPISIDQLVEMSKRVKEILKLTKEPKLFSGVMAC
jgi:hypothetical protein